MQIVSLMRSHLQNNSEQQCINMRVVIFIGYAKKCINGFVVPSFFVENNPKYYQQVFKHPITHHFISNKGTNLT